jgi:hypothetical protein
MSALRGFALALLAMTHVHASAIHGAQASSVSVTVSYPFNEVIAFGDEFSDNGNGSYAHGITGNPANVYGETPTFYEPPQSS